MGTNVWITLGAGTRIATRFSTGSTSVDEEEEESGSTSASASNSSITMSSNSDPSSWVCDPKSFKDGQVSSVSFAFEDPDGSHINRLVGSSLTAFGNLRCSIKAWTTLKKTLQKDQPPSAAGHN